MNWQTNNPLEAEEILSEDSGLKQKLGDFSSDASTNPHPSLHIVILVDRALVDECKGGTSQAGGRGLTRWGGQGDKFGKSAPWDEQGGVRITLSVCICVYSS